MSRKDFADIIAVNRRSATQLAEKIGKKQLLGILEHATLDLQRRLTRAEAFRKMGKATPFTEERLRLTLRQIKDTVDTVKSGIRGTISDMGKTAAETATENLLEYMTQADALFRGVAAPLALKEAEVLSRASAGVESSILHRLEADPSHRGAGVLDRYGTATIEHFEQTLRQGLLTGESWMAMRDSVVSQSPFLQQAPAHWAERIVRTEVMHSYNRASWDGMRAIDDSLGDLVRVLVAVFDEQTGWDSVQVHGQIRRTDEPFEWSTANGPELYMHPPNRPNDREVVVPQRISWKLPDLLKPKSDAAVVAAWSKSGRKGSPPERPQMSTIEHVFQ
jgi:hypothetical protein